MNPSPPALSASSEPQTCGLAIGSMVCGILGFVTFGLSGIAAVILGHIGLSQIKKSGGALKGGGFAVAGLITGYMTALLIPIAAVAGLAAPLILRQKAAAEQVMMTNHMKMIGMEMLMFNEQYGGFPSNDLAPAVTEATGSGLPMTGPDVLNQLEVFGFSATPRLEVGSMARGDWTYFPGAGVREEPTRVILVSPSVREKTMVLRLDSSVSVIPPQEAESLRADPAGVTIPAVRR